MGPSLGLFALGVCVCLLRCLIYKVQPLCVLPFSTHFIGSFRRFSSSFACCRPGYYCITTFTVCQHLFQNFFTVLSAACFQQEFKYITLKPLCQQVFSAFQELFLILKLALVVGRNLSISNFLPFVNNFFQLHSFAFAKNVETLVGRSFSISNSLLFVKKFFRNFLNSFSFLFHRFALSRKALVYIIKYTSLCQHFF